MERRKVIELKALEAAASDPSGVESISAAMKQAREAIAKASAFELGLSKDVARAMEEARKAMALRPDGAPGSLKFPRIPLAGVSDFARQIEEANRRKAREHYESIEREKAMLEALQAIRAESAESRRELAALSARVHAQEEELAKLRSGARGRPTSIHLIEAEMWRRLESGAIHDKLADEAKALAEWLREAHPAAHPVKPKSIENRLRAIYRDAMAKAKRKRRRK